MSKKTEWREDAAPATKKKRRWPALLIAGAFGVGIGALGGISYATGSLPGQTNLIGQAKKMQQLGELAWFIESFAYDPKDADALYLGASRGMVNALDDRYASYYTEEEFEKVMQQQKGEYVGIGITVVEDDDWLIRIGSVYDETPASEAGLQAGDIIRAMDGESLEGQTVAVLMEKIREKGEDAFTLMIERNGKDHVVELASKSIVVHRVKFEIIDNIGVIRLSEFTGDALDGFEKALADAQKSKVEGIVIDLRDNPGGDLNVVISIANDLLDKGLVMTMKSRSGKEQVYESDGKTKTDKPLAVLINGNSASASEVLAGALQDREAARIFGTTSFGKGIVQSVYPLRLSDGHIKMTTAVYFTPNGRSIHGTGIEPDVRVKLPEKYQNQLAENVPLASDTQLRVAMDYLAGVSEESEGER